MKKMFNEDRVERTAVIIAAELEKILDRKDIDSAIHNRLDEAADCKTLTNSECVVATLRALSMVAITVSKELTSLNTSADDLEMEEEEV